jgi:hypothetical protein
MQYRCRIQGGQWYWIHVNPGKAESQQQHSLVIKGCRISWVWVKRRWRFMQQQCCVQKGAHQRLVALEEQGRITPAAQFTDKWVRGCWYDFCRRSHSCKGSEYPKGWGSTYAQLPLSSYQVRGNLSLSTIPSSMQSRCCMNLTMASRRQPFQAHPI